MPLLPFQIEGAHWLARNDTAFLADEMGLGKTIQVVHASDLIGATRTLVIAPKSALYLWRAKFLEWSSRTHRVQVLTSSRHRVDRKASVVITTPRLARRVPVKLQLLGLTWSLIVADEADCYKSFDSQQTQAFYGTTCAREPGSITGTSNPLPRVWILSGTPAPNHAGELWTHLRALRPESLCHFGGRPLSYNAFVDRYCVSRVTRYGSKPIANRAETLAEIRARCIAPFLLRRMKSEVLPEFPPVTYSLDPISTTHFDDDLRALEEKLGPRISTFLAELDHQAEIEELTCAPIDSTSALEALAGTAEDREDLSRLRRLTGLLKVTPAMEGIVERLTADPTAKQIVFAVHREVISALEDAARARGIPFVTITGSVPAQARFEIEQRFQTDPSCVLFFGQLAACATAITLTASHDVTFVETSWTPRDNAQAAARAHRIGQNNHVRVRILVLAGSADEAVNATLLRKSKMIGELFA